MLSEIFGKVLREMREAKKISQEKLAEYSDLDRTYISLLERGMKQPTITTIFKLAKALKTDPSLIIRKLEEEVKKAN